LKDETESDSKKRWGRGHRRQHLPAPDGLFKKKKKEKIAREVSRDGRDQDKN